MSDPPGLRERKTARTREAIERAAVELALEQGYERTTVDEIAARADVSRRTVFAHYPTKDAIIFVRANATTEFFDEAIIRGDGPVIERLTRFMRETLQAQDSTDQVEQLRIRAALIDPYLRRALRGQLEHAEHVITQHLAAELDLPTASVGVRIVAAGVTELFMAMLDSAAQDPEHHDPIATSEAGLKVLRGAIEALKNTEPQ